MSERSRGFIHALGPGVLFTGAAVGVSHLVQSTRAGASHGLALLGLVLVANLVKYPAFRFGPWYAAATGTSLLEGYRRQGRWALALYALLTFGTMFTVLAGVTLVTAGLSIAFFGLPEEPLIVSAVILVVVMALVLEGGYRRLDGVSKVVVTALALSTVAATILVLPRIELSSLALWPDFGSLDRGELLFLAALAGWMPSAIDVSIWQSLWTLARGAQTGHRASRRQSSLDFHLGYAGTALIAVCFLLLGAGLMHGRGVEIAPGAGAFATGLIDLYVQALGGWSRPLIGFAAFATMFSTTLAVVDGFPRALGVLYERFRGPEEPGAAEAVDRGWPYRVAVIGLVAGALVVLLYFARSMPALIDLATSLSFLSAPLLAWLNHRAITSAAVPEPERPSPAMRVASGFGIGLQGLFALAFIWLWLGH